MHRSGVLESERMGAAFALLRSRDLLWSPAVEQYVRGERPKLNDLMAWNADGTRMPWRMHSEYLERLYLKNELALGRFAVAGVHRILPRVTAPMFVVGTETDHVAPWRSVYKARALTAQHRLHLPADQRRSQRRHRQRALHPKRRHRLLTWNNATDKLAADEWFKQAPLQEGSWWPAWQSWLVAHSHAQQQPARAVTVEGRVPSEDAPGRYVRG